MPSNELSGVPASHQNQARSIVEYERHKALQGIGQEQLFYHLVLVGIVAVFKLLETDRSDQGFTQLQVFFGCLIFLNIACYPFLAQSTNSVTDSSLCKSYTDALTHFKARKHQAALSKKDINQALEHRLHSQQVEYSLNELKYDQMRPLIALAAAALSWQAYQWVGLASTLAVFTMIEGCQLSSDDTRERNIREYRL